MILWFVSVFSFWGYALWYIFNFDIPESWSITFNKLKEEFGINKGYILSGIEYVMALSLVPVVVIKHPLMITSLLAIALIATAANYKDNNKPVHDAHIGFSIASVTLAILSFAFAYHLYIPSLIFGILVTLVYSKLIKLKNYIMWIETATILFGHIVVLMKDVIN